MCLITWSYLLINAVQKIQIQCCNILNIVVDTTGQLLSFDFKIACVQIAIFSYSQFKITNLNINLDLAAYEVWNARE